MQILYKSKFFFLEKTKTEIQDAGTYTVTCIHVRIRMHICESVCMGVYEILFIHLFSFLFFLYHSFQVTARFVRIITVVSQSDV